MRTAKRKENERRGSKEKITVMESKIMRFCVRSYAFTCMFNMVNVQDIFVLCIYMWLMH